jgi:hypothetical protein
VRPGFRPWLPSVNRFCELVGGGVWVGSFAPRYALINQTAIVGWAINQDTAFLTGHVARAGFRHGNFVFGSAAACVRSGVPFYEFCHARNMRVEQPDFQRSGLPKSN